MKSWLTGSGLLWSETSSSLLCLLQVPDRRRTEAPSWCETSGWDVHARGDKAGSARLSLTLPLFISLITVTWKMTCWKNVFVWRPRSRYGLRAPSPPASSWRWRTASWKFTFMNWQWTRWVETKVSLFILLLFFNTPTFLVCTCCTHSARVFALQADEARKYGARVYCVGIKDFDEQQVRELCTLK